MTLSQLHLSNTPLHPNWPLTKAGLLELPVTVSISSPVYSCVCTTDSAAGTGLPAVGIMGKQGGVRSWNLKRGSDSPPILLEAEAHRQGRMKVSCTYFRFQDRNSKVMPSGHSSMTAQ